MNASRLPMVIAHRGNVGAEPENTLTAVHAAARAGADIIELDIRLTLDRRAVVIHDPFLGRTTDRKGPVALWPSPALRRAHIGDDHVPLLREILDAFPSNAMPGLHVKALGALAPTLKDIARYGDPARTWLWLESATQVARARRRFPEVHCVLLRPAGWKPDARQQYFHDARSSGASAVSIASAAVDTELVTAAHQAGLQVFSRIDRADQFIDLARVGLDGVITAHTPDVIRIRDAVVA